jgi:hypothetical protein
LAELESAIETGRDDVGVIVTAVADELDRAVSTLRSLLGAA